MTGLKRILSLAAVALAVACNDNELLPTDPTGETAPASVAGSPAFSIGVGLSGETIATDKDDYAPGQTVVITGTGWEPGETVRLNLTELPVVHGPREWDVQADSAGTFLDTSFSPEEHHLGVTFTLTATGLSSARSAQTLFTDASKFWAGCANRTDWNNSNNWTTESSGVSCVSGEPRKSGSLVATTRPGTTDIATIPSPSALAPGSQGYPQVNTAAGANVQELLVLDNATFEVQSGGSVTSNSLVDLKVNTVTTISGGSLTATTKLILDGSVTQNGGTLQVGTGAVGASTSGKEFEIKGSRTFTQQGGTVIMLAGWKNQGTFNSTGGTVEFRGNAASDGNSFPSGTNNFFNVWITGTPGFDNNGARTIIVRGFWDNDGTADLTGNATIVEFQETATPANQALGGASATTFRNLRINNSAGVTLVDAASQTVSSGTLTLTKGNVTTGSNVLIIASNSSVSRTLGHIVGNLQRHIVTGNAPAITYDIGTAAHYTPLVIDVAGASGVGTAGGLIGSAFGIAHPQNGTSGLNPFVSRWWRLFPSGAGGAALASRTFLLRLNFPSGEAGDPNLSEIRRWDGTAWTAPAGSYVRTLSSTENSSVSAFGEFVVGTPAPTDVTAPTVTINKAGSQADPTNASPINFTVEFSEVVTGFNESDVSFTGSTVGGTLSATVTGGPTPESYNVAVTGMSGTGNVVASIPAGAATDAATNPNTASTSTDNSVAYDGVGPTVTINQAAGQADPTGTSPINFQVVFSEPVSDFATDDVNLSGTAGATTANVTGSGTTYNVAVSGMTGDGTVIASIAAGVASDALGNGNAASTSTDNTVTFVGGPTKLAYTTAAHTGVVGQCLGAITVQTQNAASAARNVASDVTVDLSTDGGSTGAGAFFSDNACSSGITSVIIASGSNSASFYYKATARGNGSHELTASATGLTSATQPQTINKADQTITFTSTAPSNAVFGGTYTPTATASSGLAVSFSTLTAAVCTGTSTISFVGVGSCTVAANQAGNNDYNAASQVTQNFAVGKATATIALSNLGPHIYDGDPKSATATTSPAGLTVVTITYDGSTTAPSDAGSYAVIASLNNANYEAEDATGTLEIDPADQTITFTSTPPANPVIGGTYAVSATATSGLAVVFSQVTPSVCTVSGSTVSFVGVGTCEVAADQAGNTNYNPAPQVKQSMTVKYIFDGFFAPVDRPDVRNVSKAGQAIPLKWRLLDADGDPVTNLAAVTVQAVNVGCTASLPNDQLEEYASGESGLQNLGDGYYQFNWKTPTSYANTCKSIKLVFGSGGVGYTEGPLAYFTFKK